MARIEMICRNCKSDQVSMDATAVWDVDKQDWVLSGIMDTAYCDICDETQLEELLLPAEGAPA